MSLIRLRIEADSLLTRHQFADRQVLFRTDCLPVVHGINKGRSSCSSSEWQNAVYRFINRICHKHNIFLHAKHIKGTDNVLSDFVSRNMEQEFLQQCLQQSRTAKELKCSLIDPSAVV